MHKGIKTILFATKLNQESVTAFNLAAKLALQFQARLIILHVIEKILLRDFRYCSVFFQLRAG